MIIRTRFAPSPTGSLHSGTVRTALFAWLLARHFGGQFLLRIEDTDQKREVPGGIENIKETLRWLGLNWDEGPDVGGPYQPYVQSQRLEIYRQVADELVGKGLAYADPYSAEELQALRNQSVAQKRPFLYREHRPANPPTWDGTTPLRAKLEPKTYSWDDAVMGHVEMGPEMVDDFILIKADGFPTYNFCHIVDDHLMEISHIIRSQEFLSSIPRFLALHETLGWQSPVNATVPPVLEDSGKRKLSKRFGARPVLEYRDKGFLPEAMLNFLAAIGWNDGTTQEVYSPSELIEKFELSRVQKSGGVFDEQRLVWLNGAHIRGLSLDDLMERCSGFWPESADGAKIEYKKEVLALLQERLKFLAELPELSGFFFSDPKVNGQLIASSKQLAGISPIELETIRSRTSQTIASCQFEQSDLEPALRSLAESLGVKAGTLFSLIRVFITGSNAAPGLFETMCLLGRETVLRRLAAKV